MNIKNNKNINKDLLRERIGSGWNTWNTRSVLSHVYMPDGLSLNLVIKNIQTHQVIRESLIGREDESLEDIHPGIKSYNGDYSELVWKQGKLDILIRSTVIGDDIIIHIEPRHDKLYSPLLSIEAAMLWNKQGLIYHEESCIKCKLEKKTFAIDTDGEKVEEYNNGALTPYITVKLDRPVSVWTGKKPAESIPVLLRKAKETLISRWQCRGKNSEIYLAMNSIMAWNTIYEPEKEQICAPVSRVWNVQRGGYALFCWDMYLSAIMCMHENPELAMANIIAMTNEKTRLGFVPNVAAADGYKSYDKSQPPVGSLAVLELYKCWRNLDFTGQVFDDLLAWNRWWEKYRMTAGNVLCWGSNQENASEPENRSAARARSGCLEAAKLESGFDNSPMYDDVPYDSQTGCMLLADVGLTGLYILDCSCLMELAEILGRDMEYRELRQRIDKVKKGMETLWDEETGIYQNRRTDTGQFQRRLSPTSFYALFSDMVSPDRVERMIREHFYNPEEFFGEYMMPTIARNDSSFYEQDYWRGRIWAPVNYLVYLALQNHRLQEPCGELANKSVDLFLKEWQEHGHVHENYNAVTGYGCGMPRSDKFYHWGALLGYIYLKENNYFGDAE